MSPKEAKAARLKRKLARRRRKHASGVDDLAKTVMAEGPPLPTKPKGGWKRAETAARAKMQRAATKGSEASRQSGRWSAHRMRPPGGMFLRSRAVKDESLPRSRDRPQRVDDELSRNSAASSGHHSSWRYISSLGRMLYSSLRRILTYFSPLPISMVSPERTS